eukprot:8743479-Karenia_brevis.AAC.1
MESCIAKGIGKCHQDRYNKRWLHLGFGCSPAGRRDSWITNAPRLTFCQVCDMVVAAAKEPAYNSALEDTLHLQWGK